MIKGSMFKKCLSLVMVIAILMSLAAPAAAGVEEKLGYFAMGDAATSGFGLDEDQKDRDEYFVKVAEYLNCLDSYAARGEKGYRVEEIRYMLDNDYAGDEYTNAKMPASATLKAYNRAEWQDFATRAEVISVHAGVNNFSTYVVEQLMYYVENGGKVKYDLDWEGLEDDVTDRNVVAAMDEVRDAVMDRLLAAAPDRGDQALEMIEFVSEVSMYAVVSYIINFNGMIEAIYELNPDVDLYIIGIYNPTSGNTLTYTKENGETIAIPVDEVIGALVEIANAYSQILAPRAYNYTYVDPGDPELLIDQMGNTNLTNSERIPDGLLEWLMLEANVDSSVSSFVEEKLGEYELTKMEIDEIVDYVIYEAEDAEDREAFIMEKLTEKVNEYALEKFDEELANVDTSVIGKITIDEEDIEKLLADLEAAKVEGDEDATEDAREDIAEAFVVDLITQNMVGQTFAGIKIETQQDAYDAIDLLERNSSGDPAALREAAADMIMLKVGENGLRAFITRDDVLNLLEQLDTTTKTSEREEIIYAWMNDLAVKKIAQKIQEVNPDYTKADARALLAAMEADSANATAIAKNHMLTTGGFHDFMVEKFTQTYSDNGLTLQTYPSFDVFVTTVEQAPTDAEAKAIVRNEIRAAAALKVTEDSTFQTWMGSMTAADVATLFGEMDNAADPDAYIYNWTCDYLSVDPANANSFQIAIVEYIAGVFGDAYDAYNNAATAAEDAFVTYRNGLDEASEAFAQYVDLKDAAAEQILNSYEESYKGAGETALNVYNQYLTLRDAAVVKVLDNYATYEETLEKVMDSVRQLSGDFDHILDLLCEIATYHGVSINDLITVANSLDAEYVKNMVSSISNADEEMAEQDKTVAYLALRYYLADAMMIMPSANGHTTIANQIIKALKGENTNSVVGDLANKVIDKTVETVKDIYHAAKHYLKQPTTASGQVLPIINPDLYVAFGDNVTGGSELSDSEKTYVEILDGALAMGTMDIWGLDSDVTVNSSDEFGVMRAEDLYWLLGADVYGDDYTADKYSDADRAAWQEYVKNADLITINLGIDNLITFPMTQTLLAYNGEETYAMDNWEIYLDVNKDGVSRYAQICKGRDRVMELILGIVDTADNRLEDENGYSIYDECETALRTVATAVESLAYSMIGYVVNVDNAVEKIASMNEDATIVLIGAYNPLEGTTLSTGKEVNVKGHSVTLPDRSINTSAIADKVINLTNRFLTNYVGDITNGGNADDEGSRIVTVDIKNTELFVTNDDNVSKNLTDMVNKTITVKGRTITIKVPEYLLETVSSKGSALHPNAAGHQYIADQILNTLDFEIYMDVITGNYEKVYGEDDPFVEYKIDDLSSLYAVLVKGGREEGEDVGVYDYLAECEFWVNPNYADIDYELGTLTITKRPAALTVTVDADGNVKSVAFDAVETGKNVLDADKAAIEAGLVISGTSGSYTADCTDDVAKNYELTITVVEEEKEVSFDRLTAVLDLENIVHIVVKIKEATGLDAIDDLETKLGLLVWAGDTELTTETATIDNAEQVMHGAVYVDGDWCVSTAGIPAKELGDEIQMRVYVDLGNGNYAYSKIVTYSAQKYAQSVIAGSQNADEVALVKGLMNYGTAAQIYFNYRTDDLMNNIEGISDADKVLNWDDSILDDVAALDESKATDFARDSAVFTKRGAILALEGAINIMFRFEIDAAAVADAQYMGIAYWTVDTHNSVDKLTLDNADAHGELTPRVDGSGLRYVHEYTDIPAKDMGETVYACAYVIDSNGEYHYSGVVAYSIETYIKNTVAGTANENERNLVKWLGIYGELAKEYFY